MSSLRQCICVAIFASLVLSACGQILPQGQLPVVVLPNEASQPNRPTVWIEPTCHYDFNDGGGPHECTLTFAPFRKLLLNVTQESTLFSEVIMDSENHTDADLHIKMDYLSSVEFEDFLSKPVGQLITLGNGPISALETKKITAIVLNHNQEQLRTYTVEDAFALSLGPFATLRLMWDRSITEGVVANMIRNIYQQMLNDNILGDP